MSIFYFNGIKRVYNLDRHCYYRHLIFSLCNINVYIELTLLYLKFILKIYKLAWDIKSISYATFIIKENAILMQLINKKIDQSKTVRKNY